VVVIGLGNPGCRYAASRHNAGFMVVDAVAGALGIRLAKALLRPYLYGSHAREAGRDYLVEPLTYMNRSGDILRSVMRRTRFYPGDLLIVYDNVDLPPGNCRLKLRGSGGGGHHGIESVQAALGSGEYMRLAVGIGRPAAGGDLAEYVLSPPSPGEEAAFRSGVERAAAAVLALFERSPAEVMGELNRRNGTAAP